MFNRVRRLMLLAASPALICVGLAAASSGTAGAASCVSRDLSVGSSGSEVRLAQTWLRDSGFNPGPVDGVFGKVTRSAVVRAEVAYGWEQNGVFSMSELVSAGLGCGQSQSLPPTAECVDRPVGTGSPRADVKVVQRWLRSSGFKPGPVDGIFGRRTKAAVIAVEKARGWTADGRLVDAELESAGLRCAPVPVTTQPAPATTQPVPVTTQPAPVTTQPAPVTTLSAPATTQPAPTTTPAADPAWTQRATSVAVPKIGLVRTVVYPDGRDVQSLINSCVGAVVVEGFPTPVYLAAHRTSCGAAGFGGVETLSVGDVVTVTYANGQTATYKVGEIRLLVPGTQPSDPGHGAPVVLQTSKSSSQVWAFLCWPA